MAYNALNLEKQIASIRRKYGLPSESESDRIWVRRIIDGTATVQEATRRLAQKAAETGVNPYNPVNVAAGTTRRTAPRTSPSAPSAPAAPTAAELAAQERERAEAARRAEALRTYKLVADSLGIPPALLGIFKDEYVRSGDINLALAAVRQSRDYDTYYPGNRREDGTIRYSEGEYRSVVDSYADSLSDFGVNPDIYNRKFGELVAGDVSAQEFRGRVSALHDVIGLRLTDETSGGAWRQEFAEEFGVDPSKVNLSTVLGVALDPEIGQEVLERRISIVQLTANATRFGFDRTRRRAEALLNAGLQGEQAQQFYGTAAAQLPRLGAYAGRYNEGRFGIEDFEDAFALGDVEDQARADRLQGREQSSFSRSGSVRQDQAGDLLGLQQR